MNPWSRELLFTESKVFDVFDLLASRIDKHLDFPWMLAEHGIHGMASLELFFDREGHIDESRSRFSGNHRLLRGLLVKAARAGLIEWFSNDTHRIKKEQFRDQHFRADFLISSGTDNSSGLSIEREGSYRFLRRRYIRPAVSCITSALTQPSLAMVDFGCLGAQVVGSLRRKVDSKYISRFNALKDTLEEYDRREFGGINSQVEGNS
ncbi:MAG: hypothetical protein NDJ90_04880 [Oligoflexia bacterium]|nr:hypothetical protein [Oligoflexia bacterium]